MPNWKVNDTAVLAVAVSRGGSPVTGLAPTCELIRESDGLYYDWAGGWQVAQISTPMVEGPTGHYQANFPQATADPDVWRTYKAFYQQASGPNKFFQSELHLFRSAIGESLAVTVTGTVGDALRVVFGILYDKGVLDNTSYNSKKVLTAGRVRLFASDVAAAAATLGAADDADGEWARFTITAVPKAAPNDGLVDGYRMVRTK